MNPLNDTFNTINDENQDFFHHLDKVFNRFDFEQAEAILVGKTSHDQSDYSCLSDLKNNVLDLQKLFDSYTTSGYKSLKSNETSTENAKKFFSNLTEELGYLNYFTRMDPETFSKNPMNQSALDSIKKSTYQSIKLLESINKNLSFYQKEVQPQEIIDSHLGKKSVISGTKQKNNIKKDDLIATPESNRKKQSYETYETYEKINKKPHCGNKPDLEENILATITSYNKKVRFVMSGIDQMFGLASCCAKSKTIKTPGEVMGEITKSNENLRPINSHLVTHEGKTYYHRGNEFKLILSGKEPVPYLTIAAKLLRIEATQAIKKQQDVMPAVSKYASLFTYVTSDDIHKMIVEIEEKTRLPRVLIFDYLKVGQCLSLNMLANYILQDIVPAGVAKGYHVKGENVLSTSGHAVFCAKQKHKDTLDVIDMINFSKKAFVNLKLEANDKKNCLTW